MKFAANEHNSTGVSTQKPSRRSQIAGGSVGGNPTAEETAIQIARVERLVFQEVVMLQQSGATSLAVSLKVDSRTELFLQLTSHDGQTLASLRFERGNPAGLSGRWNQLQECLARQDVQLLPLADRFFAGHTVLNAG